MNIWRYWKGFSSFGNAYMVLPSHHFKMDKNLRKIDVGEWIEELSWFLVSMSDLSMLVTMKNFSSNRSRVQALPLQIAQLDRICKLMLCSKFELWNLGS